METNKLINNVTYEKNIRKSYLYTFLISFHFISGVLIPFFTLFGKISFFQIMILQAFFTFSIFLLEIPTGAFADRFGKKASLSLGAFIVALAAIIYGSYASFIVFLGAELLWALGGSLISGADDALVYESLAKLKKEKESKKVLGKLNSFHLISIMIAAPLGSIIADYLGLRFTMILMAAPLVLGAIVAITFKEPIPRKKMKKTQYLKTLFGGIKYFKNHKILKILAIDSISISVLSFFLVWVYQLILEQRGLPIGYFGFIHAGLVMAQILVLNSFSQLEKISRGKRKYILYSGIIAGLGYLVLAITQNIYITILSIAVVGAFGSTRQALFSSYMNKFISSNNRTTVLSTISMIYSFAAAITNLALGYLVEWNIKYTLIIIGLTIIGFSIISKVEEDHLID